MSKYSVKKPVIVKHQSLEPQKGKSEKDRIRFLEDEIREYKRQIKTLKKALEVSRAKRD
ncbi:MAG: hypothetical protein VXX52_04260 [Candidatus Neomarinimicrobiota bacterium]|nr:hypothetical protein [Candidatus Neomarinimicrobiota bacterium]MEC8689859.1 hypothetical protein [Candidatus Neomarinimicrobiota bacterium]